MASDALRLAALSALDKLEDRAAKLSDTALLALCEADRCASVIAWSALRLASSARLDASAEACDISRDAFSAALATSRALARDCSVWLSRWLICCSDWLSCWEDWLSC
jgi:hypothetical protein